MATIPKFSNYISKRTGGPQAVLISVEITGLAELMQEMARLQADGPKAMGRALYAEALLIMAQAKKLTPVRFGWLRGSGHVKTPEVDDHHIRVEMGFGGPAGTGNLGETNPQNVGYALPVHENLAAHHPVGQAKYLETPLLAATSSLESNLATRIKADLKL